MNVQKGDLAVIRPSWGDARQHGMFVTVLRLGGNGELFRMRSGWNSECNSGDLRVGWLCDSSGDDEFPCFIADEHLRAIRDADGADETLTWAGLPSQIKETV